MKILYVLPSLQHPTVQRGGLRHYHFLRALGQRHSVTLLALARADSTAAAREEIASLVDRCLTFDVEERAPRVGRSRLLRGIGRELRLRKAVRSMRQAFLELAPRERFDVLLFHGKVVYPVIRGFRGLPTVVDFCDATSMRLREQLRYAGLADAPVRLWRYLAARHLERSLLGETRHVAFISARDRAAVLGPASMAAVIPNGIDHAYWTRREPPEIGAPRPTHIVFTGVMSYAPNADAALYLIERLLPAIRASRPGTELFVVGRDPTQAVVEAGRRAAGVTVTGWVDDVRPYLEQATVYVAPVRYASGLQNKILEALAMEVPVVTTPAVAEGLRGGRGGEPPVLVAGAGEMAAAVLALLADGDERRRLAAAGRRFVESEFDWTREAERLEAMCLEAIGQAPTGGVRGGTVASLGRSTTQPELV